MHSNNNISLLLKCRLRMNNIKSKKLNFRILCYFLITAIIAIIFITFCSILPEKTFEHYSIINNLKNVKSVTSLNEKTMDIDSDFMIYDFNFLNFSFTTINGKEFVHLSSLKKDWLGRIPFLDFQNLVGSVEFLLKLEPLFENLTSTASIIFFALIRYFSADSR